MDKREKRKKILKVSGLVALFLVVFGLSYALFQVTLNGTKKVKIKTGKLELQLLDENNSPIYTTGQNNESSFAIELNNQVPEDDESGLSQEGFTFKLKNTGSIQASYTIYLDDVPLEQGESRIDDGYVKYVLTKNSNEGTPALLSTIVVNNERELDKGIIAGNNTTNTYTLKIWIDEEATNEAMDKVFNATLRVEAVQYVAPASPFTAGTMAAELYTKGIVGEYNSETMVPNGFDENSESDGLYKYTDSDNITTYVYRGIDPDNYVSFAEYSWRIIRIESDGSIVLFRDVPIETSATDSSDSRWGDSRSGSTTIGEQSYRTIDAGTANAYSDFWYSNRMSNYDDYIKEESICDVDKSVGEYTPGSDVFVRPSNLPGEFKSKYGIYTKWDYSDTQKWKPTLSYVCNSLGSVKARTITADEFVLAGGGKPSSEFYLSKNYSYQTMSYAGIVGDNYVNADIYYVINSGQFGFGVNYFSTTTRHVVHPVITLKANTTIASGDGTSEHPYVIS